MRLLKIILIIEYLSEVVMSRINNFDIQRNHSGLLKCLAANLRIFKSITSRNVAKNNIFIFIINVLRATFKKEAFFCHEIFGNNS